MSVAALISWFVTALGGLYLLAIWLIEYDPEFQSAAATRLPVPVIASHVLLALSGLVVWAVYVITDQDRAAWTAMFMLTAIVALGLTMAVRWVAVYRVRVAAGTAAAPDAGDAAAQLAPPERHFPLPVVIGHGIFAGVTVVLVLLTVLGGGS